MKFIVFCVFCGLYSSLATAQEKDAPVAGNAAPTPIALDVGRGVPLRVIVTGKLRFKENEPVHARTVEPLFAFDREVVPAGTEVSGRIASLDHVARGRRVAAILGGDFTPLRDPRIEFDTLVLKDGRRILLQTQVTPGSGTVVHFDPAKAQKKGKLATATQTARDQLDARKRAVIQAVKTPGKVERLGDALLARLPYHPQSWPAGTRLNAELLAPLDFGTASIPAAQLSQFGAQPAGDSTVHAYLITDLDSRTATKGSAVEAILSQPLFTQDHHLLYPEGSRLRGTVVQARAARRWHRNGQLRFAFQSIEPPATGSLPAQATWRVEGQLESVEVGGKDKMAMDSEGGTKVTSSKTRFIAPIVTVMLAGRGLDRDRNLVNGAPTGAIRSNAGGQAMAGAVGFGLIGAGIGQISRPVSAAFGFYGAAWSVYSNIIGRGQDVKFPADTAIEVRIGSRVTPQQ